MTTTTWNEEEAPQHGNGSLDSRADFERALIATIGAAADDPRATQLWWCDPDFTTWPLRQASVVEALARWSRSHRRLTLLAADYRALAQGAARWHAWRRQWSHAVQCLQVHEDAAAGLPTLVFAPHRLALRLHDRERYRGRVLRAPLELTRCGEWLDALSQRAENAMPVTTLGL